MQIRIGAFAFSEVWDGVYYKALSDYPRISAWELRTLAEFLDYEAAHGRECTFVCEDEALLREIREGLRDRAACLSAPRPRLLTECTACPVRKGCETAFVCHTTAPESAERIFRCGSLLSAVRARGVPAEQLMAEPRNAAHDPADYFDYIMFTWGNCQAGDRLVTERMLGHAPNDAELLRFRRGVRFYFRYEDLASHPNRVFDGVLPMKIRDELSLTDYVYRIVIPSEEKARLAPCIPPALEARVLYAAYDGEDIWAWSEKVYRMIEDT